jgi:hypothetical protein
MSRMAPWMIVFFALLGAPGCKDKRIDLRNVERMIAERFPVEPGEAVEQVICPELVPTRKGDEFECKVVLQGGEERAVKVEQLGGTQLRWHPRPGADSTR